MLEARELKSGELSGRRSSNRRRINTIEFDKMVRKCDSFFGS
jgi:hypothetical protein